MSAIPGAGRFRPAFQSETISFAAALLTAAVLASCSPGGGSAGAGEDSAGFSVRDSSGVPIVTNRGTGWEPGAGWRLEADLQVGETDGPLAFGRLKWVAPGPAGGMLVLDGQTDLVHVFDAEGRRLRSFGGEGGGPGEFRGAAAVTGLADGRMAVSQGFPPVLHWFASDGTYFSSIRLPIGRDGSGTRTTGAFGVWQVTADGRVFVQVQVIDPAAEGGRMPVALLELSSRAGAAPDTIATWTWLVGLGDAGIRAFDPIPTWMARSDGTVVTSPGDPYEVQWRGSSGGLLRVMHREAAPVPVTRRHRDLELAEMREGLLAGGSPADAADDLLEEVVFEPTIPPVLRVWVSEPDGSVWIGVHDPVLFDSASRKPRGGWTNAWDVFERDGRYLGRLPVPDGFELRVVTKEALYGIYRDELEVSFAKRYRITRPADDESPG